MKNFLVMSDLHTEFAPFTPERGEGSVDAVLLAGDLGPVGEMAEVMSRFRDVYEVPVYAVEGNHDLWRRGRALRTSQKIRAHTDARLSQLCSCGPEMRVLRRGDAAWVGDVRIIGATLWTDGALNGEDPRVLRETLIQHMSDYRKMTISDETRGLWRKAVPEDLFREHRYDLSGLLDALRVEHEGPTIVMTHHVPFAELLAPVINENGVDLSAAYGSDLADAFADRVPDVWVYGHSHQNADRTLRIGNAELRAISNPRGYPGERTGFQARKAFRVETRLDTPELSV